MEYKPGQLAKVKASTSHYFPDGMIVKVIEAIEPRSKKRYLCCNINDLETLQILNESEMEPYQGESFGGASEDE